MKLTKFRKIFLTRFLGFFFVQIGFITILLIVEPVVTEEGKYQINQLLGIKHSLPQVITSKPEIASPLEPARNDASPASQTCPPSLCSGDSRRASSSEAKNGFGDLKSEGNIIVPKDTNFGIVIEKIDANAKVIPDVDPSSEKDYTQALSKGVAHAKGTVYPGQKGNIYLFSHSVDAPWNIIRFNAIFYLLGKLDKGDRIIMFYQGKRYDYFVFDKAVVSPQDTHFLTNIYPDSVLTLQTCDPPGTLLNRLVVRARLAGV